MFQGSAWVLILIIIGVDGGVTSQQQPAGGMSLTKCEKIAAGYSKTSVMRDGFAIRATCYNVISGDVFIYDGKAK